MSRMYKVITHRLYIERKHVPIHNSTKFYHKKQKENESKKKTEISYLTEQ